MLFGFSAKYRIFKKNLEFENLIRLSLYDNKLHGLRFNDHS